MKHGEAALTFPLFLGILTRSSFGCSLANRCVLSVFGRRMCSGKLEDDTMNMSLTR